jgi:hypothetical protein
LVKVCRWSSINKEKDYSAQSCSTYNNMDNQ